MNDAPLTDAEIAALARAGYTPAGGGKFGDRVELAFRRGGHVERNTRAEWRAIIADLPDYWGAASRAEIRAAVATLREPELRDLLDAVLGTDDPPLLVATLRGAALGLAARVKDGKR